MKIYLTILFYSTLLSTHAFSSENDITNTLFNKYIIDSNYNELIQAKVKLHEEQRLRISNSILPPVGARNLVPYLKSLAILSSDEKYLIDLYSPYCEGDFSPYGSFCMGSDISLTNWMLEHVNYYKVLKEIVIKWNYLIDTKNSVDAINDFKEIQNKYKLSNSQFYPLLSFIGLDDNGIQFDRLLEIMMNNNDIENYYLYFSLLIDTTTIDKDLPEMAMSKISYSLRVGTSKIINHADQHKTYKDFSLFGISCIAVNKKIEKENIIRISTLMTAGYELLKLKNLMTINSKDSINNLKKHLKDAKARAAVTQEIVDLAKLCTQ